MPARNTEKTSPTGSIPPPFAFAQASPQSLLAAILPVLSTGRLLDLCRLLGCEVRDAAIAKDRLVSKLAAHLGRDLPALLRELSRDELRAVCRRLGLDASARARADLQGLVLRPRLYHDKRAVTPGPPWCSLHAKCVVVDGARAFVSSANFTQRGQERNIEVGVLIEDGSFAGYLAGQWLGLIEAGMVGEHPRGE